MRSTLFLNFKSGGKIDMIERRTRSFNFYFWKFVHNAIIHPIMSFPWNEPVWLNAIHDWTANKCPGAG